MTTVVKLRHLQTVLKVMTATLSFIIFRPYMRDDSIVKLHHFQTAINVMTASSVYIIFRP